MSGRRKIKKERAKSKRRPLQRPLPRNVDTGEEVPDPNDGYDSNDSDVQIIENPNNDNRDRDDRQFRQLQTNYYNAWLNEQQRLQGIRERKKATGQTKKEKERQFYTTSTEMLETNYFNLFEWVVVKTVPRSKYKIGTIVTKKDVEQHPGLYGKVARLAVVVEETVVNRFRLPVGRTVYEILSSTDNNGMVKIIFSSSRSSVDIEEIIKRKERVTIKTGVIDSSKISPLPVKNSWGFQCKNYQGEKLVGRIPGEAFWTAMVPFMGILGFMSYNYIISIPSLFNSEEEYNQLRKDDFNNPKVKKRLKEIADSFYPECAKLSKATSSKALAQIKKKTPGIIDSIVNLVSSPTECKNEQGTSIRADYMSMVRGEVEFNEYSRTTKTVAGRDVGFFFASAAWVTLINEAYLYLKSCFVKEKSVKEKSSNYFVIRVLKWVGSRLLAFVNWYDLVVNKLGYFTGFLQGTVNVVFQLCINLLKTIPILANIVTWIQTGIAGGTTIYGAVKWVSDLLYNVDNTEGWNFSVSALSESIWKITIYLSWFQFVYKWGETAVCWSLLKASGQLENCSYQDKPKKKTELHDDAGLKF